MGAPFLVALKGSQEENNFGGSPKTLKRHPRRPLRGIITSTQSHTGKLLQIKSLSRAARFFADGHMA